MEEIFDQIETLGKTEKRVAMATLVATRGTSPKKEGAKMWVSEAGRILGGVTIGGCADARVIEEAEESLASSEPRLLSVALGEEDAWEGGFTCAGTIQVMIEPLDLTGSEDNLLNLYRTIRAEVENGKCAVVVTLLQYPDRQGGVLSKMLVFEDGEMKGTLGDAALDKEARLKALDLIQKRTSRTVALDANPSSAEVFFEVHGPRPTLIIFGAGHISIPLVGLAREMGLRTVVVDGRPRFATRERFPDVDELLIGIPSEIAEQLSYTVSTFVVLTAHDYKYDIPVLKTVIETEAVYIGLLGSKRRGQAILKFLEESGVDAQLLARVRVPTGLDIGAQTAQEIALSILAEAVAVKAGRTGRPMRETRDEGKSEK
ncbi:MAG: XdhC family protein [Blastocatellia bacterium]|nr:XdhC family protein [Blastocatellia bacterium]